MGSGCGWDIWNCGLFWGSWTVAYQVPLSMGFSGEEYWSGYSRALLHGSSRPRVEPASLSSPALASEFFTTSATREAPESNNRGPERVKKQLHCIFWSSLKATHHPSCHWSQPTFSRRSWNHFCLASVSQNLPLLFGELLLADCSLVSPCLSLP